MILAIDAISNVSDPQSQCLWFTNQSSATQSGQYGSTIANFHLYTCKNNATNLTYTGTYATTFTFSGTTANLYGTVFGYVSSDSRVFYGYVKTTEILLYGTNCIAPFGSFAIDDALLIGVIADNGSLIGYSIFKVPSVLAGSSNISVVATLLSLDFNSSYTLGANDCTNAPEYYRDCVKSTSTSTTTSKTTTSASSTNSSSSSSSSSTSSSSSSSSSTTATNTTSSTAGTNTTSKTNTTSATSTNTSDGSKSLSIIIGLFLFFIFIY